MSVKMTKDIKTIKDTHDTLRGAQRDCNKKIEKEQLFSKYQN
jgi:hypothetical protein